MRHDKIVDMENDIEYNKRRKIVSIISITVLLGLFAVLTYFLWQPLSESFTEPEKFRAWVGSNGLVGKLAFIGMMALQVIFALIPGEPMEIGAGYAFGTIEGLILCLIGTVVGASIIYLFTKLFGIKLVEAFISREKINSLKFIQNSKRLNLLVGVLYLIPGTPKDIFTYFIGLTPMKLGTFLLISTIARIPSIVSSTLIGNSLGEGDYQIALIITIVTVIVSIIGLIVYAVISKRDKTQSPVE